MNQTEVSFEQLVRDEEFRKYYSGLSSRFNSRKLTHSLKFYSRDGCGYMTLSVSNEGYKFVMCLADMGKVDILVSDAKTNKKLRAEEFQFKTADEFFISYPVIFNEYFPVLQHHK